MRMPGLLAILTVLAFSSNENAAGSASPSPITQAQYDSFLVCAPFLSCYPPTRDAELLVGEWIRRGIVVQFTNDRRSLELRCTRDATLPEGLGDLEELDTLTIDGGGFRIVLPSDAFSAPNLESVWLRGFRRLDSLPIEKGVELERLSLEDCRLEGLPGGLENLDRLDRLDIPLDELLRKPNRLASAPNFLLAALRNNGFPYLDCDALGKAPKSTLRKYLVWQLVSQVATEIGSEAEDAMIARRIRGVFAMAGRASGKGAPIGCRLSIQSGCDGTVDSLWIQENGSVVMIGGTGGTELLFGEEISLAQGKIREGASVSEVMAVMGRPNRRGAGFLFYTVTEGETEIESTTDSHLFLFRNGRLWGLYRSGGSSEC